MAIKVGDNVKVVSLDATVTESVHEDDYNGVYPGIDIRGMTMVVYEVHSHQADWVRFNNDSSGWWYHVNDLQFVQERYHDTDWV